MRDPEFTWRGALHGAAYRRWQRLIHRYGWHRTRKIGPFEPDGTYLHRCDWCGVSRTEVPMSVTIKRMQAERERRAADRVR